MRAAALTLITALAAGPVLAQDPGDDWDYAEDASRQLSIAAVTFDTFGIAVRCMGGNFSLVMSGLPEGSGERALMMQLRDWPEIEEPWVSEEDSGTLFAVWPRHLAAALAQGGNLSVLVPDGDAMRRYLVDLPSSDSAVGRVLQACGIDIAELDVIDQVPDDLEAQGLVWERRPTPSFPSAGRSLGLAAIRCEADAGGRLQNCNAESEFPVGSGFGRAAILGAHRTGRVRPAEGASADIEGRSVVFVVRYSMAN